MASEGKQRVRVRTWALLALPAAVSVLSTWPGLSGSWVGDDMHMLGNPLYGNLHEVVVVFTRNAMDYLGQPGASGPYRPVTMLTLLATHLIAPVPWLHHLVSWLVHVFATLLLTRAMAAHAPGVKERVGLAAIVALGLLFLLHPVNVEAYVWINGRSDLMAGFFLAAMAWVLSRHPASTTQGIALPAWVVIVALVAFLGACSKITFVPAVCALWLASVFHADDATRRRSTIRALLPIAAGLLVAGALQQIYAPFRGQVGAYENVFVDPAVWASLPKALAMSIDAIIALRAESMRSLAWELTREISFSEWIALGVVVITSAELVRRRDFRGFVLICGGLATLAPMLAVAGSMWLGFDRYLYMPLELFLLAAAPYAANTPLRLPRYRALLVVAAVVVLFVCLVGTRLASEAYASQAAYEQALVYDHSEDPTVVFYLAQSAHDSGNDAMSRRALRAMPPTPWPRALVIPTYALAEALGEAPTRDRAMRFGLEAFAADPLIRAHGMRWRYRHGDIDGAIELGRSFSATDPHCAQVKRQLALWSRMQEDPTVRQRLSNAARTVPCPR